MKRPRRSRDIRRSCIEMSHMGIVKRSCIEKRSLIEVLPGGPEISGDLV